MGCRTAVPAPSAPAVPQPSPSTARATRTAHRLLGAGAAALGLYALTVVVGVPATARDVLYVACFALAAAATGLRARAVSAQRATWGLLSAAMLAWAAAEAVSRGIVQHRDPIPYPSGADVLWLSAYGLAYLALVALLRAPTRRVRAGLWLDGLVAALGLAAVAGVALDPIHKATGGTTAAVATNLAYPLADVVLLAVLATAFALRAWRPGRTLWVLGGALVVQVVADTVYLRQTTSGAWDPHSALSLAWPAVYLVIAACAWGRSASASPPEQDDDADASLRIMAVPVLATGAAVVLLVVDRIHGLDAVTATSRC